MQMWRLRKTHMGIVELNKISIFLYGGRCILSNFVLHKRKLRRDSCSSSSCMLHVARCMWVVFGYSANCSCIVISGDAIIISSASEMQPSPASSSSSLWSSSLWSFSSSTSSALRFMFLFCCRLTFPLQARRLFNQKTSAKKCASRTKNRKEEDQRERQREKGGRERQTMRTKVTDNKKASQSDKR